jgi:hypothetical protein
MQTEAIFENIHDYILTEINKAQKSIYIAVEGFTNKYLFDNLLVKANTGCFISLIVSKIENENNDTGFDFNALNTKNSHVYSINLTNGLLPNNFCIIDSNTVITGSFNWGNERVGEFDSIVITNDDAQLVEQFTSEFNRIRDKFYPINNEAEKANPMVKIFSRLEILKNYILLEDLDEIKKETQKLSKFDLNEELTSILEEVKKGEFTSAIKKILDFINNNQQLITWIDPEIAALKLEIKNLENQLNAYDNEKIELEKILGEFRHRHTSELGSIILEILKLRKLKFRKNEESFKEAEKDESNYREQFKEEKEKIVFELSEDQKIELKKKFRKASFKCHPDKVNDIYKDAAQRIFIDLKLAYDSNDLKKVSEILNDLENGNYFKSISDTVNEKDLLKAAIDKIRRQIKDLESQIFTIKENDTFKTINNISNWDDYFNTTKNELDKEYHELLSEIKVEEIVN